MLTNSTILGINPGTRFLGLAVLRNNDLVDWRVKAFNKVKWSNEKLKSIISALTTYIQRYEITVIALKKFHPSRSSKALDSVVRKIENLAKKSGIKIFHYSIDELKDCFVSGENVNKEDLAKILTASNDELIPKFNKEIQNKNTYYLPMFEAIALSLLCKENVDNR